MSGLGGMTELRLNEWAHSAAYGADRIHSGPAKLVPVRLSGTPRGLLDFAAGPYLRLFGAAGIVWFHSAPNVALFHVWGALALGIFLLLAFLQPGQQRNARASIRAIWNRMFIPYVGWWLVYAIASIRLARGL